MDESNPNPNRINEQQAEGGNLRPEENENTQNEQNLGDKINTNQEELNKTDENLANDSKEIQQNDEIDQQNINQENIQSEDKEFETNQKENPKLETKENEQNEQNLQDNNNENNNIQNEENNNENVNEINENDEKEEENKNSSDDKQNEIFGDCEKENDKEGENNDQEKERIEKETEDDESSKENNENEDDIGDENKTTKEQNTDVYLQETARSQQAIHNFLTHGIVPAAVQRQKVAQYIKKQQVDSMLNGDYHEAAHYFRICNKFVDACKVTRDTSNDDERKQAMKEEIYQLEYKIDDINTAIDAELEAVRQEGETLRTNADQKHEDDVRNFIEKWENEDALISFSKPSFTLQELRRKEKQAILGKNYEAASRLKNEADELEQQETAKAQKLAQQTLEKERTVIEEKYNRQLESINKTITYKTNKLETKRHQQIHPIKCRIKKIQHDIDNFNFAPPKESHFDIESKNLNQPTILLSPRTRRKLNQFKKTPQYRKLPMQSISCMSRTCKITIPRL